MPSGVKTGGAAAVREYLQSHPGTEVYIGTLTKTYPHLTSQQLRQGVNYRISQGDPITRVIKGHCWRWELPDTPTAPAPTPTPTLTLVRSDSVRHTAARASAQDALMMVRVIGTLADGALLVQDTEAGTLLRCREL